MSLNCEAASGSSVAEDCYTEAVKMPTKADKTMDSDEEWDDCADLLDIFGYSSAKGCSIPDNTIDVLHKAVDEPDCDSDALIAQMMQFRFDDEYHEDMKRFKKKRNQGSSLVLRDGDTELLPGDEEDGEYEYNEKWNWDCIETNEKLFETIPKRGFKADKYGELKTLSQKNKKTKLHDPKKIVATAEMGLDAPTRLVLYKLINNRVLKQVNGITSTGKGAIVLHGSLYSSYTRKQQLPTKCAIKVFKTTFKEFRQRHHYNNDDLDAKDRFGKQNSRLGIYSWAENEMRNLEKMRKFGINCPEVFELKNHVLITSFIGDEKPATKLKNTRLIDAELSLAYEQVLNMMLRLYRCAELVHADLSASNILWHDNKCWFINVPQSVETNHPRALEFLVRDCENIVTFFKKRGLPKVYTKEKLVQHITSWNITKF